MIDVTQDALPSGTRSLILEVWNQFEFLQRVYNSAGDVGLEMLEDEVYPECSADHAEMLARAYCVMPAPGEIFMVAHELANYSKWVADHIPLYLHSSKMPFGLSSVRIAGDNIQIAVHALHTRCENLVAATKVRTAPKARETADSFYRNQLITWKTDGGKGKGPLC